MNTKTHNILPGDIYSILQDPLLVAMTMMLIADVPYVAGLIFDVVLVSYVVAGDSKAFVTP